MHCCWVIFVLLWCYLNIDSLEAAGTGSTFRIFFSNHSWKERVNILLKYVESENRNKRCAKGFFCGYSVDLEPGRVRLAEIPINRRGW